MIPLAFLLEKKMLFNEENEPSPAFQAAGGDDDKGRNHRVHSRAAREHHPPCLATAMLIAVFVSFCIIASAVFATAQALDAIVNARDEGLLVQL